MCVCVDIPVSLYIYIYISISIFIFIFTFILGLCCGSKTPSLRGGVKKHWAAQLRNGGSLSELYLLSHAVALQSLDPSSLMHDSQHIQLPGSSQSSKEDRAWQTTP